MAGDGERGKQAVREEVWEAMAALRVARFPFPPHGRIPNFAGAERAAERLRALPAYRRARCLKVNPDAPQLPVRAMALRDGKTLLLPTPRLRGPFSVIRPEDVPAGEERQAAALSTWGEYAREVPLTGLPPVDLVVCGSVAVSPDGARAGKGEGYSDLEYALLREAGNPPVPVVTTVHEVQVVPAVPRDPHDLRVDWILTPDRAIQTGSLHPQPDGLDWEELAPRLPELPLLREAARRRQAGLPLPVGRDRFLPDVLAPGLALLFVPLAPDLPSLEAGRHFAPQRPGEPHPFWDLLAIAGLTDRPLRSDEDGLLPLWGLGIAPLLERPEGAIEEGVGRLRRKLERLRPRAVAFLGGPAHRAFAGTGPPGGTVPGVAEFVLPDPGEGGRRPPEEHLACWRRLRRRLEQGRADEEGRRS